MLSLVSSRLSRACLSSPRGPKGVTGEADDRSWGKVITQRAKRLSWARFPVCCRPRPLGGWRGRVQHPARSALDACTRLLRCLHLLSSSGSGMYRGLRVIDNLQGAGQETEQTEEMCFPAVPPPALHPLKSQVPPVGSFLLPLK